VKPVPWLYEVYLGRRVPGRIGSSASFWEV
jgi:hypothetical protein